MAIVIEFTECFIFGVQNSITINSKNYNCLSYLADPSILYDLSVRGCNQIDILRHTWHCMRCNTYTVIYVCNSRGFSFQKPLQTVSSWKLQRPTTQRLRHTWRMMASRLRIPGQSRLREIFRDQLQSYTARVFPVITSCVGTLWGQRAVWSVPTLSCSTSKAARNVWPITWRFSVTLQVWNELILQEIAAQVKYFSQFNYISEGGNSVFDRFCDKKQMTLLLSSSNEMLFEFRSDSKNTTHRGFKISYSAIG